MNADDMAVFTQSARSGRLSKALAKASEADESLAALAKALGYGYPAELAKDISAARQHLEFFRIERGI